MSERDHEGHPMTDAEYAEHELAAAGISLWVAPFNVHVSGPQGSITDATYKTLGAARAYAMRWTKGASRGDCDYRAAITDALGRPVGKIYGAPPPIPRGGLTGF